MTKTLALFALLGLAPLSQAFAATAPAIDPCTGPGVKPNSWFITVNDHDAATRDDLLKTLDLIATGGFKPEAVFSYAGSITPSKSIVVSFNPAYWTEPGKADEVKNQVLTELAAIPGNAITCKNRMVPASIN